MFFIYYIMMVVQFSVLIFMGGIIMNTKRYVDFKEKVISNISKVIIGKEETIELLAIAFVCNGHVLLEDIPGVGKTTLVKAFAKTINKDFKRIQFTPDLLPSDLTGINYYNQKISDFQFRKGPLFTNLVLADEINRATPRTQSSLLEAMEERQITVDGDSRRLDDPFMVLATQNPIESFGTFPLPEAQVDRFFMRIKMGYPKAEEEINIVKRNINSSSIIDLNSIIEEEEISYIKDNYKEVHISEELSQYMMEIINATRSDSKLQLGVSPRGTIALYRACQVNALFSGRSYVIPEDVKKMAPYVLNHRVIHRGINKSQNIYEYIENLLQSLKVPLENI
jgi:MoxR-like ATPase